MLVAIKETRARYPPQLKERKRESFMIKITRQHHLIMAHDLKLQLEKRRETTQKRPLVILIIDMQPHIIWKINERYSSHVLRA